MEEGRNNLAAHDNRNVDEKKILLYDSALENISSGISIASDDEMQSLLFNEIVAYEKKLDFSSTG